MTSTRHNRDDVVSAAGRLFAERGYHGTSMRDLGRALGLYGSSLYSHVESKEDLLVDVVRRGAALFDQAAESALADTADPAERLRALVRGHIDVVLDHLDEARTFLNEARSLDVEHRRTVLAARDRYEQTFRSVIAEGVADGSLTPETDPKLAAIFLLSILNSVDRWYRPDGDLDRSQLTHAVLEFAIGGIGRR